MSSERKVDPFSALVFVLSIIGIILLATQDFMGFYLPGYGNRYSCLSCEYWTPVDLAAQIFLIILLVAQLIVALNDLIPKRFIEKDMSSIGMYMAILTISIVIIGLASFGIAYGEYEWWPGTGFYVGIIAGIINTVLFYLKFKNY